MTTLLEMLDQEIAEIQEGTEFATVLAPCPPVEAPGKVTKVERRQIVSGEDTYHLLSITFEIDSEEAREEIKRDKVFCGFDMMLNLDLNNCANMDAKDANEQVWAVDHSSNPSFGILIKWMQSWGWKMPKNFAYFWYYLSDELIGREGLVKVKHRLRKTKEEDVDGNPIKVTQAYISNVVPLA